MIGIYKITSPSSKVYVGQSRNIEKRFRDYKYYKGNGQNRLFASFNKYGVTEHLFEVLEECELSMLNIRERYWQEQFDVLSESGLNCLYVETEHCPTILSKTTLFNMKKAQQNRKPMTDEQKKKISESWKNRTVSDETKLKISSSLKNKKKSLSHVEKMKSAKKGFKHTEESKKKMRKPKNVDMSELQTRAAKAVVQFSLDGNFIKEWISASEISRELGIKCQLISACCTGKTKSSKGFIWKFKEL